MILSSASDRTSFCRSSCTTSGWPSFRPEELVSENVIIHDDGRMESRCLTHLGHNLPDDRDRYCIDLVCMAGEPLSPDDERAAILKLLHASTLDNDEFDATSYLSSAEDFSGKYRKFPTKIVSSAAAVVGALAIYWCFVRPVLEKREEEQRKRVDRQGKADSVDDGAAKGIPVQIA